MQLGAALGHDVGEALSRAREHLRQRQDPAGWWKGELRTNVTMDAEDLLLRQFLGILRADELESAARWIRSQQRADGTWANFEGGPADLSTTIEAYAALRLAGDDLDAPHLASAREFIRDHGGIEATRVFTRIWLALFGEWSWDDLPTMPPEIVLLPRWVPLNVYDWGCWARQTVVPITVVATLRPVRPLPFTVAELRTGGRPAERRRAPTRSVARAFQLLDVALKRYERARWKPGRSAYCIGRPSGSSPGRRPTADGAASSRRGCIRSSRCTCWATRSTIRCWRRPSTASTGSSSTRRRRTVSSAAWRPASRRSGTPASR